MSYEDDIVPLVEAGVFSTDHDLAIYLYKDILLEIHNNKIRGIVFNDDDDPFLLQREAYWLTASGRELFHVVQNSAGFEMDEEYALLCLEEIKKQNPKFYVSAFKMSDKGNNRDVLKDI